MDWATKWEKFFKTMESEYFQELLVVWQKILYHH